MNPRGTLGLSVPAEIADASVQVTSVQDGKQVASTTFTEGRAQIRVPLEQDLELTVSAKGYEPWKSKVRLDDSTRSRDLPVEMTGVKGTLVVKTNAPGLKGEVDLKLVDSSNKVLGSARTVEGMATFKDVPTGRPLAVKGSAPDYVARTAAVRISPPEGTGTVSVTLVPNHGTLRVALKGENLTRAGYQVRILAGDKVLARAGAPQNTFAKLPLDRDLVCKVTSELHQTYQKGFRLTPEVPEASLEPILVLAPPSLKITTEPKATILVDGKEAGQADATGRLVLDARILKTGQQHTIKATKKDFVANEQKITAKPNSSLALALDRVYVPAPVSQREPGPGYAPPPASYSAPAPVYAPPPVYRPAPAPAPAPAGGGTFLPPPTGDH